MARTSFALPKALAIPSPVDFPCPTITVPLTPNSGPPADSAVLAMLFSSWTTGESRTQAAGKRLRRGPAQPLGVLQENVAHEPVAHHHVRLV